MSRLLGVEYPSFIVALEGKPVAGLRVNTLKLPEDQFGKISPFPLRGKVPWCPSAFYLDSEDRPGKHPFHLAGLYYLQDPSAMSAAELLAPRPGERVLDLTAAPGGKATHMASLMEGQGLLVANEIKTKRLNHLMVNVERWAAGNILVTNETPERLADHFGAFFDRVLVDAPCSGEGMFRKDMSARLDWSPEMVAGCAIRQRNILRVAAHLVRPGGHLLYSTCTFAPEEDEGVIAQFLNEHPDFEVGCLSPDHGFTEGRPDWLPVDERNLALAGAIRLWPHRLIGEGHFVCHIQHIEGEENERVASCRPVKIPAVQWKTWQAFRESVLSLDLPAERLRVEGERLYFVPDGLPEMKSLRVTATGIWLGNFKKDRFEPAHALALYLKKGQAKNVLSLPVGSRELSAYLRGESLASEGLPGWVLVCADQFPLGWGKRVQGVVKNHFPRGWMVL